MPPRECRCTYRQMGRTAVVPFPQVLPRERLRLQPLLVRDGLRADRFLRQEAVEPLPRDRGPLPRSEEHTSELQSLMRISYAVLCLKQKNIKINTQTQEHTIQ